MGNIGKQMMYFLACHYKNPVRGHKPGFHILRKKKAVPDIWELAFTVSLALVFLGASLAPTDDSASPPVNPKKNLTEYQYQTRLL